MKFQIGIVLLFWLLCQIVVHLENPPAADFLGVLFQRRSVVIIASSAFTSSGRCPSPVGAPMWMDSEERVRNAEGRCGPRGVSGHTPPHWNWASSLRERKQQLCKILLVSDSLPCRFILANPGAEKNTSEHKPECALGTKWTLWNKLI